MASDGEHGSLVPTSVPEVSIVIPVFNHPGMTVACLTSLANAGAGRSFEVIVVDDASTDGGMVQVRDFPGVVYLRNDTNLGFVHSCNAGAALARGRVIVLLNNDTLVTSGWVDRLVDTLELPDVGLVGACLQYPDGSLQEAGGIVFSDASGWNYGRGGDPSDPRYRYRRSADYCSGAAVALPRRLFEELGGLDVRYAPAYYEDTDLAMRVRAMGLRVVYEPDAVVVHLEGVSAGTDLTRGMKAYQVANRDKFLQRWDEVLRHSHPAPGTDPDVAVRARARYRLVAVCGSSPEEGRTGFLALLASLARQDCAIDLHLMHVIPASEQAELRAAGICVWTPDWLATARWMLLQTGAMTEVLLDDGSPAARSWVRTITADVPRARAARFGRAPEGGDGGDEGDGDGDSAEQVGTAAEILDLSETV